MKVVVTVKTVVLVIRGSGQSSPQRKHARQHPSPQTNGDGGGRQKCTVGRMGGEQGGERAAAMYMRAFARCVPCWMRTRIWMGEREGGETADAMYERCVRCPSTPQPGRGQRLPFPWSR